MNIVSTKLICFPVNYGWQVRIKGCICDRKSCAQTQIFQAGSTIIKEYNSICARVYINPINFVIWQQKVNCQVRQVNSSRSNMLAVNSVIFYFASINTICGKFGACNSAIFYLGRANIFDHIDIVHIFILESRVGFLPVNNPKPNLVFGGWNGNSLAHL